MSLSTYCSSLTASGAACMNRPTHFEGNCVVHHNYKRRHDAEYRNRYTESPDRKEKNKALAERRALYKIGTLAFRKYLDSMEVHSTYYGLYSNYLTRSKSKALREEKIKSWAAAAEAAAAAAAVPPPLTTLYVGNLTVEWSDEWKPTDDHVRVLGTVDTAVGTALENAGAYITAQANAFLEGAFDSQTKES